MVTNSIPPSRIMLRADALCPKELPHATRMEWIANYFIDHYNPGTPRGPGTPAGRFDWMLNEMEKRFPDPEPFSSSAPEVRYFEMLDKTLKIKEVA